MQVRQPTLQEISTNGRALCEAAQQVWGTARPPVEWKQRTSQALLDKCYIRVAVDEGCVVGVIFGRVEPDGTGGSIMKVGGLAVDATLPLAKYTQTVMALAYALGEHCLEQHIPSVRSTLVAGNVRIIKPLLDTGIFAEEQKYDGQGRPTIVHVECPASPENVERLKHLSERDGPVNILS